MNYQLRNLYPDNFYINALEILESASQKDYPPLYHRMSVKAVRGFYGIKRCNRPNPYRLVYLEPGSVSLVQTGGTEDHYTSRGRFNKHEPGLRGGKWHEQTMRLENSQLYTGLRQRFKEGLNWEDTALHPDRYEATHRNLPLRYEEYSLEEFLERGEYIDRLYQSIRDYGYRNYVERRDSFWDELAINIGPGGELIRNSSGLHRLIISKMVGVEEIPVRVLVVHPRFIESRL